MNLNQINVHHLDLRTYQPMIDGHSHDFAQLVLPIEGELELNIGAHSGIVDANKAAFIPYGESHDFAGSFNNLFLVVDIKNTTPLQLPKFIQLTETTKKFIDFTHSYLNSGGLYSLDLVQNLLLNLLAEPFLSDHDSCVSLAKSWIDLHYFSPINIGNVAKQCNLSLSQLQRRFKRATGVTIAEYWRNQRLEQSKLLLLNSHRSIETIAYEVGYENLSAFSRRFSTSFGISPSQWREMRLSAQNRLVTGNTFDTKN